MSSLRSHLIMTHSSTFSGLRFALFGETVFPAVENTRAYAQTSSWQQSEQRRPWQGGIELEIAPCWSTDCGGVVHPGAARSSHTRARLSSCSLNTDILLLRLGFSLAISSSLIRFLSISVTESFSAGLIISWFHKK